MFSWLHRHRRVEVNPCASVHRPDPGRARDRVLTDTEIVKFWNAASAEADLRPPAEAAAPDRLPPQRGRRMRRSEIDGELWTIPGSRTKNHRPHLVPLAPMARDLIASAKTDLVFTTTGTSPFSGWSKLEARFDTHGRRCPALALPRSPANRRHAGMAEIGILPHVVEACLNHVIRSQGRSRGNLQPRGLLPEEAGGAGGWAAHVEALVSASRPRSFLFAGGSSREAAGYRSTMFAGRTRPTSSRWPPSPSQVLA